MTHRDVMVRLAKAEGWKRGAELGVGSGLLFERLLTECPGLFLMGVDTFNREDRRQRVEAVAARFPDKAAVIHSTTVDAASTIGDRWLDFVFIDAGHSYVAVKADIEAWWPKVKPGGWFGGHDYHDAHPGVVKAVLERFVETHSIHLEQHAIWWVRR